MTLKYSDDEFTDEKLGEINLQTAAHQYMIETNAQQKTTPIPFQKTPSPPRQVPLSDHHIPDGQNTKLSISSQLSFWMEHQELGYKFHIWKSSLALHNI